MLSDSLQYEEDTPKSYKKKFGQFFTNDYLKQEVCKTIDWSNIKTILEPSVGSGEFVSYIDNYISDYSLDGYEIDENLYNLCKSNFPHSFHNKDFLTSVIDNKYDLIIGNPPYFELKKGQYDLSSFSDVVQGRVNIYTLFIKKSIDLLNDNGILSFVIPISLASGNYFKQIRKYIINNTDIISLKKYTGNEFLANQQVMVLTLKKEKNKGKYLIPNNDDIIFSEDYKEFLEIQKTGYTLQELGYAVRTGTTVGNLATPSNSEDGKLLIWSDNIKNNKLELRTSGNKRPQYIEPIINKDINKDIIVVNRVIGKVGSFKLQSCFINQKDYYVENHLNIIEPVNPKIPPEQLLPLLQSDSITKQLNMLIGNTQLSKTELETLIRINI